MSYSSIASKLKTDVNVLKNLTTSIKNINFDSVWSGDAHSRLTSNLKNIISKANTECTNLSNYATALDLLEEYKKKKEELSELKKRLNNLSDDEEYASERAELSEQISKLEKEIESLKSRIQAMIKFNVNAVEYELVSFQIDENTYKDFTYIVDLEKLLGLAENDMLVSLTDGETLYNYYSREEVNNTLASIKEKYSGREAAVNCTLAMMQMAADVGKKLRYGGSRDIYDIGIRSDCAIFASWAVNQGTENGDFPKKNVIKLADSGERYKYYEEAQPGDVLYHLGSDRSKYHATFLVQNDTENKKVIIAEASSVRNGVRLREMSYAALQSLGYKAVNMSEYYED